MGTSKNSFSMKSTAILRHSELRSVAEPQQCQSKLCHCTRLLQQSSFKVAKSIQAEHRDSKLVWDHDRGAEADAKGINTTSIHHFSFLLWLDLVRFHSRKPIFRGTLMYILSMNEFQSHTEKTFISPLQKIFCICFFDHCHTLWNFPCGFLSRHGSCDGLARRFRTDACGVVESVSANGD